MREELGTPEVKPRRTDEVTVCRISKDCETALDSYRILENLAVADDAHSVIAQGNERSVHGGPL